MHIFELVDNSLKHFVELGGNFTCLDVPDEMFTGEYFDECKFWKAIDSTVNSEQISNLEIEIGVKLPDSYKSLIRYKHYIELSFADVHLPPNSPSNWQSSIRDKIFNGWPCEYLFDKGYIPFADYSDWGIWCFDTSLGLSNGEYPVVLWDHEKVNEYIVAGSSLTRALLNEIEKNQNT